MEEPAARSIGREIWETLQPGVRRFWPAVPAVGGSYLVANHLLNTAAKGGIGIVDRAEAASDAVINKAKSGLLNPLEKQLFWGLAGIPLAGAAYGALRGPPGQRMAGAAQMAEQASGDALGGLGGAGLGAVLGNVYADKMHLTPGQGMATGGALGGLGGLALAHFIQRAFGEKMPWQRKYDLAMHPDGKLVYIPTEQYAKRARTLDKRAVNDYFHNSTMSTKRADFSIHDLLHALSAHPYLAAGLGGAAAGGAYGAATGRGHRMRSALGGALGGGALGLAGAGAYDYLSRSGAAGGADTTQGFNPTVPVHADILDNNFVQSPHMPDDTTASAWSNMPQSDKEMILRAMQPGHTGDYSMHGGIHDGWSSSMQKQNSWKAKAAALGFNFNLPAVKKASKTATRSPGSNYFWECVHAGLDPFSYPLVKCAAIKQAWMEGAASGLIRAAERPGLLGGAARLFSSVGREEAGGMLNSAMQRAFNAPGMAEHFGALGHSAMPYGATAADEFAGALKNPNMASYLRSSAKFAPQEISRVRSNLWRPAAGLGLGAHMGAVSAHDRDADAYNSQASQWNNTPWLSKIWAAATNKATMPYAHAPSYFNPTIFG